MLDLVLPDGDGRTLLAWMRERPATAGLPVLILSCQGAEATKTECFALGAEAYFEKPVPPATLAVAVASHLLRAGRASEETRVDALTGLPNRAAFVEHFHRLAALSRRSGVPLALAVVDVDHFKAVNDRLGHSAGDQVLRQTATLLRRTLRGTDVVARWGGDEFAVLLPDCASDGGVRALELALDAVRREPLPGAGEGAQVSFSAGIAGGVEALDPAAAFDRADARLFAAKALGGCMVVAQLGSTEVVELPVAVVDDDPAIRMLLRVMLEADGLKILEFEDGASALAGLNERRVGAIILDLGLPEIDGFAVLSSLRRSGVHHRTPILVLTGRGDGATITRAFADGADDFITKPLNAIEFLARLRRFRRARRL